MVIRYRDRDNQQVVKVDYYLSNAVPETPLGECARVAKAAHRIEACLQRSKSEAGLADYEVRNWTGWQHHQTLSLLATWFLVRETERGKKWTPAITLPQIRQGIAMILREAFQCGTMSHMLRECQKRLQRNELARFYHCRHLVRGLRRLCHPLLSHQRLCVHHGEPKGRTEGGTVAGTVIKASLRGRFCISDITGPSVALGAVRDGLLTLTTRHSIVGSTASARADARGGKQDATMVRG